MAASAWRGLETRRIASGLRLIRDRFHDCFGDADSTVCRVGEIQRCLNREWLVLVCTQYFNRRGGGEFDELSGLPLNQGDLRNRAAARLDGLGDLLRDVVLIQIFLPFAFGILGDEFLGRNFLNERPCALQLFLVLGIRVLPNAFVDDRDTCDAKLHSGLEHRIDQTDDETFGALGVGCLQIVGQIAYVFHPRL